MAPGQEWRTLFDVATVRAHREDLPLIYKGVVTYDGLDGEKQTSDVVIDLHPFKARIYPEIFGVHHAAKALQDIRDNQKKWTEFNRLSVIARDGDAKDARDLQYKKERRARWEAQQQARSVYKDPAATFGEANQDSAE